MAGELRCHSRRAIAHEWHGITPLPAGRKSLYYELYCHDRRSDGPLLHLDHKPADLVTFLRAWRQECWMIVVAKSQSLFTKCGVCDFLKNMLDSTPKTNHQLLAAVRSVWATTSLLRALRGSRKRLEEACMRSSGQEWCANQFSNTYV